MVKLPVLMTSLQPFVDDDEVPEVVDGDASPGMSASGQGSSHASVTSDVASAST